MSICAPSPKDKKQRKVNEWKRDKVSCMCLQNEYFDRRALFENSCGAKKLEVADSIDF